MTRWGFMPGVSARSLARSCFGQWLYPREKASGQGLARARRQRLHAASDTLAKPPGWPVLAHRNPMLLLRFMGVLLLRDAERRFATSLLFHDPPRITRLPV